MLHHLLRANWHLGLLMLVFLAIGLYGMRPGAPETVTKAAASGRSGEAQSSTFVTEAASRRLSEGDRAQMFIDQYRQTLASDPASPEAPALLSAMGNLYRQKRGDYARAAQCYERLLHDYPEWDGHRKAYIQLVACYEKLGDEESLRTTYRRMMEAFPADTQEHLFAKAQLGL